MTMSVTCTTRKMTTNCNLHNLYCNKQHNITVDGHIDGISIQVYVLHISISIYITLYMNN